MTNANDPVVKKHGDATIKLESSTGQFYCYIGDSHITDKTLAGVIRKLDQRQRASARAQALALPTVVLELDRGWRTADKPRWFEGVFKGVNAHTGEVTLEVKGQAIHVDGDSVFFRADDPALPAIRDIVEEEHLADRAQVKAEKAREVIVEKHGHKLELHRRHGDKATAAADAEERLVRFLAPKEGK